MFKNLKRLAGQTSKPTGSVTPSVFTSALIATILAACSFSAASAQVLQADDASKASSVTARSIKWETSLEAAEAKAKQNGKPILWVHMLGNVDGYT